MPEIPAEHDPAMHIPVLLREVVESLALADGARIIDGTFGRGGYSAALLEGADCRVLGIDRDPDAIVAGQALVDRFGSRLTLHHGAFGELSEAAEANDFAPVDAVVLDIGVSSMQLDQAERGFSFMKSGPLDMRMSQDGFSAADVVNSASADELADILFQYGEERRSRAIAHAIVERRQEHSFETTEDLVKVIVSVLGAPRADKIHPATRTFQALRIYVNDELGELVRALCAAERVLVPGGRLVVVTFHSLEDRIVKRFFTAHSRRKARQSRHIPQNLQESEQFDLSPFQIVNHRAVKAGEEEVNSNPRARSARLRWGVRTAAPPVESNDDALRALGLPRIAF